MHGWVHKMAKISASEEPGEEGADVSGRFYQFIAIIINFTHATYVGMSSAENQDDPSSTPDLTKNQDSDGKSHTELHAMDLGLTKGSLQQLPRSQNSDLSVQYNYDKCNYPVTYIHGYN